MTEQQNDSAMVEKTGENVGTPPQQKNRANSAMALSAVAIAIALAAGIGLYSWTKHQASAQMAASQALASQFAELQKMQSAQKEALQSIIKQQADQLDVAHSQQAALTKQLNDVERKVAAISGSDAKTWLLAQADYLVKLAGRKLWSDQDVTTAAALLKSADASLAEMNDPSLLAARRALTDGIAALSAISQVDYDGIILKVNQLSNQIDNLRLADTGHDASPMDTDDGELSTSVREWRVNLQKSWQNFMDNFITIRRRDETAIPLLAPNQDVYLRENIRSRLLVAAQAVPRHQGETYKQALDNVSTWVRAYYDTDDSATQAFLDEVDALSQQSISMNLPANLQSQLMIEKLVQTRVRNLLAQPAVSHDTATAPVATSPATPAPAAQPQGE